MDTLPLSECLAAHAADCDRHALSGMVVTGAACMLLAAAYRQMAARAAELEAAERALAQMEAVARDLDPTGALMGVHAPERAIAPHLGRMREVVASGLGSAGNVVPFPLRPLAPRPAPTGGGAA